METVLKEFKENNTIYYSEYINQNIQGILYWVSNKDEYTEIVEEFEKKNNALVYHIISTPVIQVYNRYVTPKVKNKSRKYQKI